MIPPDQSAHHDGPAVVALGASAGGLPALRHFFATIPEKSGVAWVVIVHLSPQHESYLAELIQPHAPVPIRQVTDTTLLEPDHIYVIPPGRNLTAIDTHLRVDLIEASRRERAPIDHFYRTLAATHGSRAVAVVLTGTGSDGSLGLRRVKEHGGLTVAQEPSEAEFDGMPQSAIATGFVDLVLPIRSMVSAILSYLRTDPQVPVPADAQDLEGAARQSLITLLALVRARTGRDFARYKRSTVLRRIRRRMQLRHLEHLDAYIEMLRADATEMQALSDELLINVTSFFRDPEVFATLEKEVVPKLFEENGTGDRVRIWSVGCATGEEAYSLGMLLLEEASRHEQPPAIQVFASDLHEHSLAQARAGFYPQTIETEIPPERIARFFVRDGDRYRVSRELREIVVFAPHDLLGDPPFSQLDMIACRNVLIYLQRDVQGEVMRLFHYALRRGGYLVLGTSETVDTAQLFQPVDEERCIHRRRTGPRAGPGLPVFPLSPSTAARLAPASSELPGGYGALHLAMLEQCAPPSVLVDRENQVVHVSPSAGRYLSLPGGEVTNNVFKLVADELRFELRAALHAAHEGRALRTHPILVEIDGTPRDVALSVHPARETDHHGYALVIFDETAPLPGDGIEVARDGAAAEVLEAELAQNKQQMRAIIQEYETAQEEMRASNEELQSANEELRATMEELETSREELQSLNEELITLNQENRHKVEELSQLSGDLHNLLTSTDIATLFLDRRLRILRFTPRISELFSVRESDRGRPIADLTHRLGHEHLFEDAERVLAKLVPIEREVRSVDGRWFLARVLPYRTTDDRIEGIVLTFVDVSALKRAEEELRETEQGLALALEAAEMGTFDLEVASGVMRRRTPFHDRLFGYVRPQERWDLELTRRHVLDEDRARFDAAFAAAESAAKFDVEVRVRRPDDKVRWLHLLGRTYVEALHLPVRMLGVVFDVTESKKAQEDLIGWSQTLEARVDERTRQVRELATRLARAEHEERRRIAHVLHDDLQQLLYAAHMRLAMAIEDGDKSPPEALAEVNRMIESATERARRLTVDLSPPVLRGEGLAEALEWLANQTKSLHGLAVEIRGTMRIPNDGIRVMLFQMVRELLFNVVKHSGGKRATVTLAERDARISIEVADDGAGFDPTKDDGGSGLRATREHVELLGGQLDVDSTPAHGARVTLSIPADLATASSGR